MDWVLEHWKDLLAIGGALLTILSIIAKLTPSKSDDVFVDKLLALIKGISFSPKKEKARE